MSKKLLLIFLSLSSISLSAADDAAALESGIVEKAKVTKVKRDSEFNKTSPIDDFDALDPLKKPEKSKYTKEELIVAIGGMGC
jgi:hypothetical protein